jgi:hypothetical protein
LGRAGGVHRGGDPLGALVSMSGRMGSHGSMPDDQDYADLRALLASPLTWSARQASTARLLLDSQRRAVEECQPKDLKRRRAMQEVVDELQAAIDRYENKAR